MAECGCLEYEPGLVIAKCDACREKERLAQQPKPVDLEQVQKDLDHAHGSPGRFNLHQGCRWARAMIPELRAARAENKRLRDGLQTVRRLCENPTDGYGTRCKEAIRQVERSLADAAKGGE